SIGGSGARELAARLRAIVDPNQRRSHLGRRSLLLIAVGAVAMTTAIASAGIGALDDDPLSERLPPVAMPAHLVQPTTPDDVALMRELTAVAQKSKTWDGDLVAERARWALAQARDGRLIEPLHEKLADG